MRSSSASLLFLAALQLCFAAPLIPANPNAIAAATAATAATSSNQTVVDKAGLPASLNAGTLRHHMITNPNDLKCDVCEYVTAEVNKTVFSNPKVLAIVTGEVDQICKALPESVQTQCLTAATAVVPELLAHLGDFVAEDACKDLKICDSVADAAEMAQVYDRERVF